MDAAVDSTFAALFSASAQTRKRPLYPRQRVGTNRKTDTVGAEGWAVAQRSNVSGLARLFRLIWLQPLSSFPAGSSAPTIR
jgi:hypothetical protein